MKKFNQVVKTQVGTGGQKDGSHYCTVKKIIAYTCMCSYLRGSLYNQEPWREKGKHEWVCLLSTVLDKLLQEKVNFKNELAGL